MAVAAGGGLDGGGTPAADPATAIDERAGTTITAAQVQAAYADLLKTRLDAEVAAGRLTQERADAVLARAKDAPIGAGLGHRGGPGRHAEILAPVADLLGITEDALHERLRTGRTMTHRARAGRGPSRRWAPRCAACAPATG